MNLAIRKILSLTLVATLVALAFVVSGAPIQAQFSYSFRFPLDNYQTYSFENFGEARSGGKWHLGVDISRPAGTPVYAAADGIVRHVGEHTSFGTVILIEHQLPDLSSVVSLYGHLRGYDIKVSDGQSVSAGTTLGYIGNYSENGGWGEHLHFGIRKGAYVDVKTTWVYWGLGDQSLLNDWYSPTDFIVTHSQIADPGKRVLTGPGPAGTSHLRSFYLNGEVAEVNSLVLDPATHGGADVASGDTNGDGHDELIFGAGPGAKPEVSVRTQANEEISIFPAYDQKFRGGIRVAAGDVDGDGHDEIITAPRKGGGGQIRIFEEDGRKRSLEFWPYGPSFRGGVDVAVANVDLSTSKEEIIVAPESGYQPLVKIYKPQAEHNLYSDFLAFDKNFRGGVRVSAGNVDNDPEAEVVVGAASSGGHVRVLEAKDGAPRGIDFFPFGADFREGVDVGTIDYDSNGKSEIIIGSSGKSTARVKVYKYNIQREILLEFLPYTDNFRNGTNVSGLSL